MTGTLAGLALDLDTGRLEAADETRGHAEIAHHGDRTGGAARGFVIGLRAACALAVVVEAAPALAAEAARLDELLLDQAGVKRLSPK